MKKLISLLILFVFSLFIANSQTDSGSTILLGDSIKSVTVNVNSDTKKQVNTVEDLQLQLTKSVDSQTTVNKSLNDAFVSLDSGLAKYTQAIEERNKSDGKLVTDMFSYTPAEVKQVIRKERWLNFITVMLCISYALWATSQLSGKYKQADLFYLKLVFFIAYGLVGFLLLKSLLTLIFNGDYYVIKELMQLYT